MMIVSIPDSPCDKLIMILRNRGISESVFDENGSHHFQVAYMKLFKYWGQSSFWNSELRIAFGTRKNLKIIAAQEITNTLSPYKRAALPNVKDFTCSAWYPALVPLTNGCNN